MTSQHLKMDLGGEGYLLLFGVMLVFFGVMSSFCFGSRKIVKQWDFIADYR